MQKLIIALLVLAVSCKDYTVKVGKDITYSKMGEDKMIGFLWKDFDIPNSATITQATVSISTTKTKLGKWQGAWGTSTSVSPEYWTMTEDLEETFTDAKGSITWDIDSATAKIIQKAYGGELKWGVWWIDCDTFTIDEVTVTATESAATKAGSTYELKVGKDITYSKMGEDKMIGFLWKDFDIPNSATITEAAVTISTTKTKLGKWQGAWGTSTSVSPEYWTMTEDLEETFTDSTGTITWDIDSATAKIIQKAYGGELKWGVWWIDCDTFTIDKVVVTAS